MKRLFLFYILTKYDIEHEIHPGIPTTPNYWVKKLVLDELNEKAGKECWLWYYRFRF